MCGIAGKLNFKTDHPIDTNTLAKMTEVLAHRGPDGHEIWHDKQIGLGHRRLAIIDLTPSGRQPMCNEDSSIWITYNGEIYNHESLRNSLIQQGHVYRGRSDTETIIHLYEEHGWNCVNYLRGMFAFGLWDQRKRNLLLARDRFGQKPLVYADIKEGIVFASEIKALLQDPHVSREIDYAALSHFLTYGFVPGPMTIYKNIRKLPPASVLVWQDGDYSIREYWHLKSSPKLELSDDEAAERAVTLLQEATELRLMSEVPLGAFLSGGLDSSSVVAMMTQVSTSTVKTFTIGFEDRSSDERPIARRIASHLGIDHREFTVAPNMFEDLPELIWAYGEPFADSSALPTYNVSKMARQYVTVALNGDGGDEAFVGYERYLALKASNYYQSFPRLLTSGMMEPLARFLPAPSGRKNAVRRVKNFILSQNGSLESRYARWLTLTSKQIKQRILSPEFLELIGPMDSRELLIQEQLNSNGSDVVERANSSDFKFYLPDDLLVKLDIATMSNSLEARSPFLDYKLIEFAARLPMKQKFPRYQLKYLLKKAMKPYLPHWVLNQSKRGFRVPVGRWFREDLRHTMYEILLDPTTTKRGVFQPEQVRFLLDEHVSGKHNHRSTIWTLLTLELWFRTYIDRPRLNLEGPIGSLSIQRELPA